MTVATVSYTTGEWLAVCGARLWALVQIRVDDPRVPALWEAADIGADDVLDLLVREGIRALPGFAIVEPHQDGLRCLVRDPADLTADDAATGTGDGPRARGGLWVERYLPRTTRQVRMAMPNGRPGAALPTRGGIVPASTLLLDLTGASPVLADERNDPATNSADDTSANPEASTRGDAVASTPSVDTMAPDDHSLDDSTGDASAEDVPQPPRHDIGDANGDAEVPTTAGLDHAETYYQLLVSSTTDLAAVRSKLAETVDASEAATQDFIAVEGQDSSDQHPDPDRTEIGATGVWNEDVKDLPPPPPGPDDKPAPVPSPSPDVIDGLPWAGPPMPTGSRPDGGVAPMGPKPPTTTATSTAVAQDAGSPLPSPPRGTDPKRMGYQAAPVGSAEVTTNRAALLRQLSVEHIPGPTVLAVQCPRGHVSPTYAAACRTCGAQLPEQTPVEIPRPSLGRLVFSNGTTVPLDRGVVLGRAPQSDIENPADRPNVVRLVESGEISRMHASVVIEGWQVLLRDLGSQNGTFLTAPGGEPEQLRSNVDYELHPGAEVSLADAVSFTFEVD